MPSELKDPSVLTEHTPWIVSLWIRYYCGKHSGSSELSSEDVVNPGPKAAFLGPGPAYGWLTVLTMRAAATYYYVCEQGQENTTYARNSAGKWSGNPCNSHAVHMYMRLLNRQKVRGFFAKFIAHTNNPCESQ